jgi:outer membrane protein assembly factor BamB
MFAAAALLGLRGDGPPAVRADEPAAPASEVVAIRAPRLDPPENEKPGPAASGLVRSRPEVLIDLERAEDLAAKSDWARALAIYSELLKEDESALVPVPVFAPSGSAPADGPHRPRGPKPRKPEPKPAKPVRPDEGPKPGDPAKGGDPAKPGDDPEHEGPGAARLYVPVREEVQRRLATLPPQGLQAYRGEWDPVAADLLRRARDGDGKALAAVLSVHRRTTAGPEAVELAAARAFDRRDFDRAARLWDLWLEEYAADRPAAVPAVTVRLAVAYLATGRPERARDCRDRLAADKAAASAELMAGGRRVPALVYLENLLSAPPAALTERLARDAVASGDWPMIGGRPDAGRPGEDVPAVPVPAWGVFSRHGEPSTEGAERGRDEDRRAGDALAERFRGLRTGQGLDPGHLEPERAGLAVAGDKVIVRYRHGLVAYDAADGRRRWLLGPEDDAGLDREPPSVQNRWGYGAGVVTAAERGRCGVSVADGVVFTVERFPPVFRMDNYGNAGFTGGNRLTARSLADGKRLWSVGRAGERPRRIDEDDADEYKPGPLEKLVDEALFLTAPTPAGGRLYVPAETAEGLHLVCLSASDGRPLWARPVSQRPIGGNPWQMSLMLPAMGSPAAVSGGVAYCLTNAGTLAACDAADGRLLWVFEYAAQPSEPPPAGGPPTPRGRRRGRQWSRAAPEVYRPPNPVFVAGGKVVFLPADSSRVWCLDADSGRPAWSATRADADDNAFGSGLPWLAGVAHLGPDAKAAHNAPDAGQGPDGDHAPAGPEQAVVLVGPEVRVLSMRDGRTLRTVPLSGETGRPARALGRPSLSAGAVHVCAERPDGRGLARVGLADGRLDWFAAPPPAPGSPDEAPLGNLVAVRGKMFAAADAAVAAYLDVKSALTRPIDEADPSARLNRGALLSAAGRPAEAEADLRAALAAATGLAEVTIADEARRRLSALIARSADAPGLSAADRAKRLGEALSLIGTVKPSDRREADLTLRENLTLSLAAVAAERGNPKRGVELAMGVAVTRYPDPADEAHRVIDAIIRRHGRTVYGEWDGALLASLGEYEPDFARIFSLYRHSAHMPDGLVRAAISAVREAGQAATLAETDMARNRAGRRVLEHRVRHFRALSAAYAERLVRDFPASRLFGSAVELLTDQCEPDRAREWLEELSRLARLPDYKVQAPRWNAKIRDRTAHLPPPDDSAPPEEPVELRTLGDKLTREGAFSSLLRDAHGRPLVHEGAVMVLSAETLSLVDPSTGKVRWRVYGLQARGKNPVARGELFTVRDADKPRLKLAVWDGASAGCVDMAGGRLEWLAESTLPAGRPLDWDDGVAVVMEKSGDGLVARIVDVVGRRIAAVDAAGMGMIAVGRGDHGGVVGRPAADPAGPAADRRVGTREGLRADAVGGDVAVPSRTRRGIGRVAGLAVGGADGTDARRGSRRRPPRQAPRRRRRGRGRRRAGRVAGRPRRPPAVDVGPPRPGRVPDAAEPRAGRGPDPDRRGPVPPRARRPRRGRRPAAGRRLGGLAGQRPRQQPRRRAVRPLGDPRRGVRPHRRPHRPQHDPRAAAGRADDGRRGDDGQGVRRVGDLAAGTDRPRRGPAAAAGQGGRGR